MQNLLRSVLTFLISALLCLPYRENFVDVIEENLNYLDRFSSMLQEAREEQNNSLTVSLLVFSGDLTFTATSESSVGMEYSLTIP